MVRKRGVPVDSPLLMVFTRHLNMECFESPVPANFVSYAPIFFVTISTGTDFEIL